MLETTALPLHCQALQPSTTSSALSSTVVIITKFSAEKSDPRKASIFKVPLQVGFGRHSLFESASLEVLTGSNDYPVSQAMVVSFSQIGMALAFGGFNRTLSDQARYRWDMSITRVPKAPLFFLVCTCFLYTVLASGIAIAALCLRRVAPYSEAQTELLPRKPIDMRKIALKSPSKVKELAKPDD